ncbi:MAG: hypothetical protein JOZ54_24130, partial [Acidobacteria bacterium]|nr:hypothetical protein [Acidobacteriota bacterium]
MHTSLPDGGGVLAWSDVRPLVVEVLARAFEPLGFRMPGRVMWRYRPQFIDVVRFDSASGGGVCVAFGSTPRISRIVNIEPHECAFYTSPTADLGLESADLIFLDDL